jgi:excisionase family DNA binding protein
MSIDADQTAGLLTITEVAEFLRISIPTVRRLIEQREIPFLKVGGSIRFTRSDIDTYLEKRRVRSIDHYNKL